LQSKTVALTLQITNLNYKFSGVVRSFGIQLDMGKVRKPSIVLLVARVLLIAAIATLLTFAVALFFGIAGVLLTNLTRGGGVGFAIAYRLVALPMALLAFAAALVTSLVSEIRLYRRARNHVALSIQHSALSQTGT
jgi:hypothetical protein